MQTFAVVLACLAGYAGRTYWTDGTWLVPGILEMDRLHDPSAPPSRDHTRGPVVGDRVMFWAIDYTGDPQFFFYLTSATCRFAGDETYIFVEDSQWGVNYGEESLAAFAASLEDSVPSGPAGIVETVTSAMGPVPDEIDGDPRVYFLVLDIRDGFDPSQGGAYIAGFFSPYNQFTDEEAYLYYGGHSNEVEMLYIDCYPGDEYDAAYTASHELVHLVQWGIEPFRYDSDDLWVSENLAQAGTFICGYPAFQVGTFIEAGGVTPVAWTEFSDIVEYVAGYGAGFLFSAYLFERYGGEDYLFEAMRTPEDGLAGVADAIRAATGLTPDMQTVLTDWALATWIDDTSVGDGRWGWESFRIADYDTLSPGNRPGLDFRGIVEETPWEDPAHSLDAWSLDVYSVPSDQPGSFRASGSGMGDLQAWLLPETGAPEAIPTGAGDDVALAMPLEGEVVLMCRSFSGMTLEAFAGSVAGGPGPPAVFPQPCLGTLYFQFQSSGEAVFLDVFAQTGALVEAVDLGVVPPGESVVSYPGASGLATGVYMYIFTQGGDAWTGRFAVVR